MTIMLTKQFQERLRQSIVDQPLTGGEIRRAEGMGELYFSMKRNHSSEYYFQYTLEIDGTDYHFFGKKVN